jgi:hypothetical protein
MDWPPDELYADDDLYFPDERLSRLLDGVVAQIEHHREQLVLLRKAKRRIEAEMAEPDAVQEALQVAREAWERSGER